MSWNSNIISSCNLIYLTIISILSMFSVNFSQIKSNFIARKIETPDRNINIVLSISRWWKKREDCLTNDQSISTFRLHLHCYDTILILIIVSLTQRLVKLVRWFGMLSILTEIRNEVYLWINFDPNEIMFQGFYFHSYEAYFQNKNISCRWMLSIEYFNKYFSGISRKAGNNLTLIY